MGEHNLGDMYGNIEMSIFLAKLIGTLVDLLGKPVLLLSG